MTSRQAAKAAAAIPKPLTPLEEIEKQRAEVQKRLDEVDSKKKEISTEMADLNTKKRTLIEAERGSEFAKALLVIDSLLLFTKHETRVCDDDNLRNYEADSDGNYVEREPCARCALLVAKRDGSFWHLTPHFRVSVTIDFDPIRV